jgi:GNAT superfamily N-acetyltransferase
MAAIIRPAGVEDEPVLWQMIFEAAHMADEGHTSIEAAKARPDLARYVAGWPLPGDLGVVAVDTVRIIPVGAAWVRLLTGDNRGYGWVDDATPELAMGILPGYRGQRIGTVLLTRLLEVARSTYRGVSLSVRADNKPAVRLYEQCHFRQVPGSEVTNWAGGVSYNMKVEF